MNSCYQWTTLAEIHIVSPNQLAKITLCHIFTPSKTACSFFFLSTTTYHFPAETASQSPSTNDVSPSFQVTGRTGCFGQVGDWVAINPIRSPEVSDAHKVSWLSSLFCGQFLKFKVFKLFFSVPHWRLLHCKLCLFLVFDFWNIDGLHSLIRIRTRMSYIGLCWTPSPSYSIGLPAFHVFFSENWHVANI